MNETLTAQVEEYFRTVTPEQLQADLKKCDFAFYNSIGRVIGSSACIPPAPTRSAVNQAAGETPRTDALRGVAMTRSDSDDFARTLERELTLKTNALDGLRRDYDLNNCRANLAESQLAKLSAEFGALERKLAEATADPASLWTRASNAETLLATATRQNEEMAKELEAERNLHGQTRVVVEELNTICNDLRNAGQMPFIRSEAIRLLREDQAELRGKLSAALAMVETMRGAITEALTNIDNVWDNSMCTPASRRMTVDLAIGILRAALSQVPPTAKGEERP